MKLPEGVFDYTKSVPFRPLGAAPTVAAPTVAAPTVAAPTVAAPTLASPPGVFNSDRSVRLGLPNEIILNERTGEVIEMPHGSAARIAHIFSRGLDKGDADTKISKLYFELFMGNDTPTIRNEIARLQKISGGSIKTKNYLEEMFRATGQQLPVLKHIFGKAAERAGQGGIGGGLYGLAVLGVGAVPGFFAGIGAGALSGTVEGTFVLETGETFAEISQFKHKDGSFVDPTAARIGAVVAGAMSAGLEVMPMTLLFRLVPGSKNVIAKLGDKALKGLKIPTGKTAFRKFVLNISTIMAVETGTEVLQELTKIAVGDVVKLTTDVETPLTIGNNALERVADVIEEVVKATPLIATGFSVPRLGVDIVQGAVDKPARPNTKQEKVKDLTNETVDSVTAKLRKAPVSEDLKTYDVGNLNETEQEELDRAGIEVADNGTIVAEDAELIAAESQRRTDFYKKQEAEQSKAADKGEAAALRKVARGRIRKLDEEVGTIDQRIDDTLESISLAEKAGTSTKRLKNRINSLLKKREILDEERAHLLTADTPLAKTQEALKAADKQIELKGAELLKAERRIARARERALQKGVREGIRLAKTDVAAAQKVAIDAINNSNLDEADKGKFLNAIRGIKTAEQLQRALPRIQARINKLVEKSRRRIILKKLKKAVKTTKVKRLKGKFGPEIQEVLDVVRKAFNLSPETAQAKLEARAEAGTTEIPSPIEALENRILALRSDVANTDLIELEELLETIVAIRELGKGIRKADILRKQEENAALRAELIELMGPPRKETDRQRKRRLALAKAEVVGFLGMSGAWWNKVKRIMRSSDKARVDEFLNKMILFDESRNYDKGKENAVKRFTELMLAAMNITSERGLMNALQNSETELLNLGAHTHADGTHKNLDIETRAQLRKRIMELKDPELKESMMNEEKGNMYTPQIIEVLEQAMTEQDWRLVDAQLQFYEEYYQRINEVYRRIYGFNLPKIEFYSPIKRQFAEQQSDEFMKGIIYRGGVAPGSLKGRKPNIRTIKPIGDLTVFHSHVSEMEYFIAYAEKTQQLNQVFANPQVQDYMHDIFGPDLVKTINKDLDSFSKRGVQNSIMGEEMLQVLYRNFTFAQLGAKPQIGLKQLASFAAYAEDVELTDFIVGVGKFVANPRKALRILNESQFFRDRGINIDQDYKAILEGKSTLDFIGKNPTLAAVLMIPIRLGDKGAIAIGGFAHIHAMMKQNGGNKKKALRSFELLSARTQQSTDIDQLSELQRTSSLMRVFSRFMSGANAMTRAEYNAILDRTAGRISNKKFAERMIIYHIFIPGLIQFIANGLTWDSEDQLRASMLGTFNGVFLFKDVADALFRFGMGTKIFDIEGQHPMGFTDDMFRAMADFAENGISWEDIIEGTRAIDGMLDGVGAITGIPVKTIANELRGFKRISEELPKGRTGDELTRGVAEAMGYSTYTIDEKILAP
jgi:hypothetical protein